jgi:hypothetical protein
VRTRRSGAGDFALDPLALIEALCDAVDELAAVVNLPADGRPLCAKLDAAAAALLLEDTDSAIGSLGAFINQVRAFVRTGRLSEDQGEESIEAAEEIIDLLGAD